MYLNTPPASVLRLSGSLAKLELGPLTSQAGPPNTEEMHPACQSVPDSSGNTFAPSQAYLQHCSRPSHTVPESEAARSIVSCSSQNEGGWHLQLDGAVTALVARGR